MSDTPFVHSTGHYGEPVSVCMADVMPQVVDWLWYPYLAYGQLALLEGDPDVGKSMLTLQIATCLSRGWSLPDQQGELSGVQAIPRTTIFVSSEDALTYTVRPRLESMGANAAYVHVLQGAQGHSGELIPFTLKDLSPLIGMIQHLQPALVVIDPIQAYFPGSANMNQANHVRWFMSQLITMAEHYHCAVLCVRHASKGSSTGGGKAVHRGAGSVDIAAAARLIVFVEQHPVEAFKHVGIMAHTKANIGPKGHSQLFMRAHGQFGWCGASRVQGELVAGDKRGPDPVALLEAVMWLEGYMGTSQDQCAASQVFEAAAEEGHTRGIIYKAKKALGIISESVHVEGTVHTAAWRLPPL
jgi:hypothetical protein